MNSTKNSIRNTIGAVVLSAGIIGAGVLGYNNLIKPASYDVFQSRGNEYFVVDNETYAWKKATAKKGTTYCSLGTGNGLLLDITEEKNMTDAGSIYPGQELYVPYHVEHSQIPERGERSNLEERIIKN
jgi:hypothetical protein